MDEWYSQHSIGADALSSIIAREANQGGWNERTESATAQSASTRKETSDEIYNRLIGGDKK